MSPETTTHWAEALEALRHGDEAPAEAWLRAHSDDDSGCALALRAALFRAGHSAGLQATQDQVAPGTHLRAAVATCEEMIRICFTTWAADSLKEWVATLSRLSDEMAPEDDARISLRLAESWCRLFDGANVANVANVANGANAIAKAIAKEVAEEAARRSLPSLVIEAHATIALCSLDEGALVEATRESRLATRMARTEGQPQPEYFANIVLAATRRASGAAHLSSKIIGALGRAAPQSWHGWLAWELALAGEQEASRALARNTHDVPSARCVWAFHAAIDAAANGEPETYTARADELAEHASSCCFADRQVRAFRAASDPKGSLDALDGEIYSWCAGDINDAPQALRGLCSTPDSGHSISSAVAFIDSSVSRPRRLLALSLPMITTAARRVELLGDKRRSSRTDIGLAVLLLAGHEGLSDEVLFRRSYGFDFRTKAHRGALDVLKHRLRTMLEAHDELDLQRLDGRNVLTGSFCAADPRCTQAPGDRALRHLVATGRCSAKELSARLGVSLRSAQQVLKELVEDGSCHVAKDGRAVQYYVEDTTFSEPTRSR